MHRDGRRGAYAVMRRGTIGKRVIHSEDLATDLLWIDIRCHPPRQRPRTRGQESLLFSFLRLGCGSSDTTATPSASPLPHGRG